MSVRRLIALVCLAVAIVFALVAAGQAATLSEVQKLTASDAEAGDRFGRSVAIDGNTAFAGADGEDDAGPRAGAAYVFDAKAPTPTPTIPPVGGIAFEPELGAVAADAAPSGDGTGTLARLVAAPAAGIAALAGLAWFTSRRRVRIPARPESGVV